jgi:hypothetical protein
LLDWRRRSFRSGSELGAIVFGRRRRGRKRHRRPAATVEDSRPVPGVIFHRVIHARIRHIVVGVRVRKIVPAAEIPGVGHPTMMAKAGVPDHHRYAEAVVQVKAVAAETKRSDARRNAVETGVSAKPE